MDHTRAAIVEVALTLFGEKGFTDTTIDEIAERADVGRRTFFRYFPAKEAVLFHHTEAQVEATMEALRARPGGEPPYEALLAVLRGVASQFGADAGWQRLVTRVAQEHAPVFQHHRAVVMCRLEDLITAEMAERQGLDPDDIGTRAAVAAILAAFGSAIRGWIMGGAKGSLPERVETALGAAQQALANPAGC
jgi:TetR/AcrR family transcriptional regulator, regulator of mycofactocin system